LANQKPASFTVPMYLPNSVSTRRRSG
jgi:hypothetical protein